MSPDTLKEEDQSLEEEGGLSIKKKESNLSLDFLNEKKELKML